MHVHTQCEARESDRAEGRERERETHMSFACNGRLEILFSRANGLTSYRIAKVLQKLEVAKGVSLR
jgi:hypothetical protein